MIKVIGNQKRQFGVVALLCLTLLRCETAPKSDGVTEEMPVAQQINNDVESKSSGSSAVIDTKSTSKAEDQPQSPQHAAASSKASGLLDEAIRSQSDEKIKEAAEKLLSVNGADVKAMNALAMYYYKKGRFDAAKYLLSKAVATNPNVGPVYSNLGIVHLALDEEREAVRSFKKAVALDESDAVSSANLGAIYAQNYDYTKAVLVLETAVRKGIKDAKVLNNYGIALMGTGKFEMAEDIFKQALKDSNSQKETLFNYAILLIDHLVKKQEGMDVLNRLKFIGPSEEMKNKIKDLENKAKAGVQ